MGRDLGRGEKKTQISREGGGAGTAQRKSERYPQAFTPQEKEIKGPKSLVSGAGKEGGVGVYKRS